MMRSLHLSASKISLILRTIHLILSKKCIQMSIACLYSPWDKIHLGCKKLFSNAFHYGKPEIKGNSPNKDKVERKMLEQYWSGKKNWHTTGLSGQDARIRPNQTRSFKLISELPGYNFLRALVGQVEVNDPLKYARKLQPAKAFANWKLRTLHYWKCRENNRISAFDFIIWKRQVAKTQIFSTFKAKSEW